jgi:hypothetical protein
MVINLYLDRIGHFESDSLVSSMSAKVEKSLHTSLGFRSQSDVKFYDWIWYLYN